MMVSTHTHIHLFSQPRLLPQRCLRLPYARFSKTLFVFHHTDPEVKPDRETGKSKFLSKINNCYFPHWKLTTLCSGNGIDEYSLLCRCVNVSPFKLQEPRGATDASGQDICTAVLLFPPGRGQLGIVPRTASDSPAAEPSATGEKEFSSPCLRGYLNCGRMTERR